QRERLQRRDEPALGEERGMETARELADLLQPGRQLVDRRLEQVPVLYGPVAHPAEAEQDRRQPLLCAVVEVALDPPPLGVGDLHEPRPRRLQLLLRL